MAISIGTTQYGRDSSGARELIGRIEDSFNNYSKEIKDIANIKTAVIKNWSGADADDFIKTLEYRTNLCVNRNKNSVARITDAIYTDIANFNRLQRDNAGIIK